MGSRKPYKILGSGRFPFARHLNLNMSERGQKNIWPLGLPLAI